MSPKKLSAIADDLRKIGTTAVAALSEHRLLTAYAFLVGVIIWSIGIFFTQEE